jgi:hypothetical protein
MKNFEFYQDIKVERWKRQFFSIAADTEEEAVKQAECYKANDVTAYDIEVTTEDLYETEICLSPSENDGQNTIELYLKEGNRLIGGNEETEIKCNDTFAIVCPYCGFKDDASYPTADLGEMQCDKCGKHFEYVRETVISYSTEKI